jgi:hypothetical protein
LRKFAELFATFFTIDTGDKLFICVNDTGDELNRCKDISFHTPQAEHKQKNHYMSEQQPKASQQNKKTLAVSKSKISPFTAGVEYLHEFS